MSAARLRSGHRASIGVQAPRRRWPVIVAIAVVVAAAGSWSLRASVARSLARHHVSRAERMLASGDDGSATVELEVAVEEDPLQRDARRLLGELHLRHNRLEHAFLELQSYAEAFPEDPHGWSDLAEVRLRASQPEQAEAALTDALDRARGRDDLRQRRAKLRLGLGRYHGALVDAQAILQRDGGVALFEAAAARLASAHCLPPPATAEGDAKNWPGELGVLIRDFAAATRLKDWTRAAAIVRSARERYPRAMLAPWLEGLSSFSLGDLDSAERSFNQALALSPRSHRPVTNLVAVWSRRRGPAYAGDQLVQMVEHDPAFAYPLPIAAAAYVEADQPAKAEATIRRLFAMLPLSPVPYREVAKFLLHLDRASDAMATVNEGLTRFPADPDLLEEQARGYAALGDREAAIRSDDATLAARPDDQHAAAQLALLLVTARNDAASRQRAARIVRELECDAPSDPDVLGAMGLVLLEAANDAGAARTWLEAARDRAPKSPQLRYRLALAYARGQDVAGARRELRQALQSGLAFDEEPEARRLLEEIGSGP
jgi:Flp pilus assembly protein TadD